MYAIDSYNGSTVPDKTLCLTFDDGPGEHTCDIGKFLYEEGIKATFFVVGKYAYQHPDILQSLMDWGHLIGNHTYEHPDMPYYRSVNGDVQDQIIRTDAVIKKYISSNTTYFRSPYGKWSEEVASDLNSNVMAALNHIGPIHWDIDGVDCYYWQLDRKVEDAAEEYLKNIAVKRKGIVVFHDEIADMDYVKPRNKTLELLKLLIPKLKSQGYQFIELESIESIKKAATEKLTFYLQTRNHKYISLKQDDTSATYCTSVKSRYAEFTMEKLPYGKIVLQASNGFYLGVNNQQRVLANKPEVDKTCLFDLIPVRNNQFMLRATSGNYLTIAKHGSNNLIAEALYMRNSEIFFYSPVNVPHRISLTVQQRISLIKKRFLYIKSKVFQA